MSDYIRGVLTTGMGGYGYIQSMSWAGEADEDMARDEQGITKYYDPFNALANLSVTVRFDRETDTEDLGYMFTIMGCPTSKFDGRYIQTAPPNLDETNVEGPTVVFTMRRYIDGEVPVRNILTMSLLTGGYAPANGEYTFNAVNGRYVKGDDYWERTFVNILDVADAGDTAVRGLYYPMPALGEPLVITMSVSGDDRADGTYHRITPAEALALSGLGGWGWAFATSDNLRLYGFRTGEVYIYHYDGTTWIPIYGAPYSEGDPGILINPGWDTGTEPYPTMAWGTEVWRYVKDADTRVLKGGTGVSARFLLDTEVGDEQRYIGGIADNPVDADPYTTVNGALPVPTVSWNDINVACWTLNIAGVPKARMFANWFKDKDIVDLDNATIAGSGVEA